MVFVLLVFMYPSHKNHLGKLNRVSGQVSAIKRMIEDGEYCVDIMNQVRAARNALKAIELAILETHMKSCIDQASCCNGDDDCNSPKNEKINEIISILKKYE